jgi:hypothetical protein
MKIHNRKLKLLLFMLGIIIGVILIVLSIVIGDDLTQIRIEGSDL